MLDDMEELTLQVSYLIPFIRFCCKVRFKSFPVIKFTYGACLKIAMWFVFASSGLIVFMDSYAIAYSEPFQTSKM